VAENGLRAHKLFTSSEESWEMRDRINLNPMFIRPPKAGTEMGSRDLAYILEGEFTSYFAGKPIPEKKQAEEDSDQTNQDNNPEEEEPAVDPAKVESEGEFLTKGRPGKIFLMASSEMLKDNILNANGRGPNETFVLNVVDFLNNREDIALMRSKEQRFNPLDDTGAGTKTFIKSFNIVGLAILVNIFGLLVWFRRHSRKRRIQMMFQS